MHTDCLPISEFHLCLYIQFLSRSLKSPQSVRNYVSGLKCIHLMLGLQFPSQTAMQVKLTYKGLDKCLAYVPSRAAPITPQMLLRMAPLFQLKVPDQVVIWCLFLFLFFLFARKSQFIVDSGSQLEMSHLVQRQDVTVTESGLQVRFRWSKTHQSGGEPLVIPLSRIPGSVLCPVSAFQRMVHLVPASPSEPLFTFSSPTGNRPIRYKFFHTVLRACLRQIGLQPSSFSSHSFRRGGASYAFLIGVRGELIQSQGDWKSDAYKLYLELGYKQRVSVSKLISQSLM